MNENEIITLAPNVTIKYIDDILVGAKNYYKYEVKVNSKQKNLYLNEKIGNDLKQRNDVYNFILNNENNASADIFLDLDIKDEVNSSGSAGEDAVQKSRNQNPKLSENWVDYIDNALTSIRNTSNCSIGVIENFFNKESSISGKYKYIDDNMSENKNLYKKMLNSGARGYGDLSGMVANYTNAFNDIAYGILEMYDAAQTKAIDNDELKMMDDKSKEYFGTEDFNSEFKDILSNSKLELKKTNNNFLFKDMFKEIGALQAKYSIASLSENESIFKSISNSIDDKVDADMKDKVDELVKYMAGILGISELEARKAIKENPIEMANELYNVQMSIAENVKNGGSGYDTPEISTSFWEFKDSFYSTEAGQEALFNRFLTADSDEEGAFPKNITPYDEKNSVAYTNYITYCMQIGKLNWLMDSCKDFPIVIDKINNNDVFTIPEEVADASTLSYIAKNIEDYNVAPFGYVKKGNKWYQVNYTKRGQDMLYYMDYHCGENSSNSGDNRVITAFSNQGRVDSVERNYKGLWIDSHLNGDYDKNSSQYKSVERDYYVLNGVIEDEQRYNELIESGELSFKDLVTFSKIETDGTDKLTDINYINEHKDEIKSELGLSDKQLYNFSVLFSKDGINTGDIVLDPMLEATKIALSTIGSAGVQIFGGLLKFGENVGDAVNTAIHSDFALGSVEYDYTNWDGTGEPDTKYDLTKEFKEFRDSTWKVYFESDKYNKDLETFKNSVVGLRQLESKLYNDYYQFSENADGYYYVNGKVYKSVVEIPDYVKENAFADLFKQNKLTEWNLHDSSSSNYYLAAFKEGIREGGIFTRFDNLNYNIVENAKMQFNTQDDVELDKTGEWMQSKIYDTDFYKNMEDYSFVKKDNILGMVFNQVGNMAVPIAISMIPGMFAASSSALGTAVASSAQVFQGLSSAALFTSAFGGAAEEAFISGASYNEALKYATLSATTELAIEHLFSGIGGYGEGWLDDALEYLPNKYFASKGLDTNLTAQTLKTLITGGLGEAVEEVTTDFVTPLWQSMTYMNDKTYYDVLNENVSLESLAQTALVSFLSSMIFKGVEINQQTSTFNKNLTNLQNRISTISDINLDTDVLETQAKKVLAEYIGGIIENEGIIKSGLLEQLINNASNQLVSDPKSREQLNKLQDELIAFKNQNIILDKGKNSINLTGSELLRLEDLTGFDGKYSVEDGKIKFENQQTQNKFNSSVLELAQKQASSYNASLKELISGFENSREKFNTKNLQDAINSIIQYGNIEGADLTDLALFEYDDSVVVIPKVIAQNVSTKLSIEEGKITFKKDMTSSKFIDALYKKAINLCNDQIGKTSYDIKKAVDKGLINKAIDIIKPSLESQIANILVTNVTPSLENNLTKIDVETTINGEQRNISIYVDGSTDSSVYKQSNELTELIQKTIMKNENSNLNNIYLGELVYDSKEKVMNSVQNKNNQLYVNSLELENAKKNGSMYSLQSAISTLMQNGNEFRNSSDVKITHDGVTVIIPESILKEITNKYKIIDGNVKFNQDMNIDKFIVEVYDKALDINKQTMEAIENTKVKNSTYVNTDGMDLYRLKVETVMDGETRTVNVYVDGNTDISSIKDSSKISEKLYEIIAENKNSNNVYAGKIVYDEKTGKINVTENTANKLYVDSINAMSETDEHSEVVTSEEVIETTNEEVTPSEEIKKGESYEYTIEKESEGESYEYTIEEVKEDNSNVTSKEQTETVTNENRTRVGSESVITNVAQAASVGVTAGATSQAIYQNNTEVTTRNTESQTKDKNVQSNIQNKENIHVETEVTNVISINEIKSQVSSFIDSIKTECEKYIELHHNDENFEHRFEQFKQQKRVQLNDKLSEIRKTIADSNNTELNVINEKINSLSESDSLRNEYISQRDKIIERQQQEISDIENTAREKLQKVFSELVVSIEDVYFENAEPLILTKDFVSTLTLEQKEFLAQISTEEGLIEYLQNNPLTKVELLERSELTHTDNKYVNKLIELINENEGTTKQIYNVEDVVRNNSNPIFIESTYKGDAHTLSTNEVLNFMKTGKVDTKYSYPDYVKATYSLMNDLASQKATIDINGDVFNGLNIYNEISGYLDGSSNFTALDNLNIIEKCNKFYEFISKNNISLDSDVMEKLDFISKLEENKTIANLNDYFNGKSPIVMDKYIRVYDREISTQSLIDLVEMKSPNYLILLRDYKISSIPNSERFHITRAIDKLMSSNTDLAEYYKSNYEKFNNIYQNKYVLKNSYILVPSTIGEYQTKYIDYVLDNPYAISIYDGKERQQIISTVNAFAKFLDKNNLSSYYSRSKLDFLNRKVVNIDSSISYTTKIFKMFDANSESFGANQGAVREILKNAKVSDAVQILFGETIETKDFMQTLNNMQFTEEQFKKALLTANANNLLPLDDIEILNTLIDQVVENYPGMSKKDALQFLYLLESHEAGSRGICNYASMVNLIFDKYKNNIDLFEEHFGYPMYVTINGKERLNTTRLLVDMYSTINDGVLVTRENDTYKVVTSSKDYRNLTRSFYGDISKENFERFLTKKGIKFNINEKFTYSTVDPNNMLHYEEIIASVRDSLANGEHVHLTSMNFSLYNLDGSMYKSNIEPHIMSVVGINEDGNLIVDSWGQKLLFDLRDELARLTNDDLSLDALKIKHYTTIVSYDISMDDALSSNETVTNIENSNIGSIQSTLTLEQREFLTQNSPVSSNISEPSIITDSNMDFVDVGELLKTTEINIEDVMPNMDNPTKTIVPRTFDIVIDGKVESSLKLEELVSNGYKLSTCYELMEESQFDEFNSAIVNYIDYIRENNISVDIDSNVEKFYESYKYAKENNVFIVNEDRILEKGADMIAIPQEIYNKYQNDLTYQVVINTIINSVESLNNFEKFIQNLYLVNEKYRICTNNIINFIDSSIRMNENFNAIYNVISKLSEHTMSDNTLCLANVYDMIYKNAEPIYLPNYINGEFRDGHQAIKMDILLDTILGKNQFPNSYNANITENCRVLYNYLQSNNITLNENIMEKLEFVNSLNEDQIILNASEYFEGKSPIVTTEFIYLQDSQISSLDIMEILKMDSDEYIKLLRDGICEFKNISSDNLILSIQRLLSQNQTLREQYNENYIKLKDLYSNNYVLKNTLTIVPETFNGYYTSLIDTILNNPNFINSYSISQKHNLAIVINDFIEYLKSNNVEIEYHEYEKVLEFLNRNVPNIDSSIAIKSKFGLELETNEKNGGAFGSDQGILRMLFEKVNMNAVIEKLFGNKIETEKLLEVLKQMNISDEEFTRQLLKTNRGLLFAKNTTEIRMIEDLANQVMKNYPGMSKKEAIQFLYLMETKEAGGTGICNYASLVNLIFNKYMDNPSLFEEKLGYPMYVTIDGKKQLNTATLLVDLYSIINEDVLVTKENGIYKIAINNDNYLNLTNGSDGTIVMERFQKFLDKKGIDMNVNKKFTYNSNTELMHYEELIINIHDALARGEHVHISAWNFDICRPNGSTAGMDVGGHIMSVLEITKDGHLIVDSWGERFMIDLKSQMSKTGNYSSSSKICVVSYDISLDNVSNVSTALDLNTDVNNERNTHNSAHIEVFDVPNPKSNVTSSVITDEDLKFIDEGSNTRDVGAFKVSAQDMQRNVRSTISINIDGVEITIETLKELQTPSNLETALKTGEYAGVRVEKALVELSKLDGVTLDSKLQELVDVASKLSDNHVIFNIEKVYHDGATAFVLPQEFLNELTVEEKDLLSRETKFITQISNSKLDAKELIRGVNDQLFRDILSEITTQIKEDSQEFFREWQITNEKDKGEKFIKYDYKKIREQYPIFRGNEYNKFANTVNKIKEDIDIKTKILEKYSEYINKEGKDLSGYGLDKKKQKPYKKNINSSINGLLYQKNIVLEHVSETEFVRAILSPEYEHIKKYARWFKNKKTAIMLNEMIQRNYRIKNAAADIRYDIQKDAAYMLYDIQKEIILKEQETIVEVKFDDGRTVSVKSLFNPIVFDSMKLDNLIKQLDGLYSWPVKELFISDAFCPSNFIAQIQLKTRKIFIANHSLDLNSKTSYIWDGNLTEERIIYKFAEAMVREIAITKPEMIEIWEGVISRDNSFVSEHAKNDLLIDMTESIAAAIMDPGSLDENGYHPGIFGQQFPERNKLILEGYGRDKVKLIDISRLNGLPTKLYDVNKKINSVSDNSKVVLKDTKNVSNSLILDDSDISYEMKHLLYEGKLIIRNGQPIIYGAHNMQHFDDLVRNNSNLKISGVTPHPSIRGISNVEYYLTDANGNIIGRANFPKTVYDPSVISDERILKLRDEALRNGTFVDNRSKIGMATNGLLFQAYYVDGRLDSGFPFATSEMAGIEKFMSQFKLPVTINGRTQYVDVSIDGETDPIVISQYGPKLIKYVESLIKENGYTYKTGDIICLDELRYDSTTDSIISVTTTNGNMNIINDTFEVYDGSELKNTLNLRELIGKNTDLFNSYSSISEEHRSELLDKIVEYVDYVKQYRSDIEIDANVEKFYNAYMSAKQNNLHIVNVENIIKNGSDMLAISEDLYVECQNKPLCNELVSKIANGIDSIDAYEQLIKNQVERLVLDTETKQKILQGIDLNVNNNENLRVMCEVLSKIDFDIMKSDNSYVYNLHEMFSQNADPIYLPYDFSDLLQYIVGKGKFNISQIESIIKQSKLLNNYLQSNNIVLNENIMEKLEFISKLNDNQIISNLQEYFDGQNPIVVNKYTNFGKTEISTLKIIEFLEMKSDLYIEFLRDVNTKYLFDSINKLFKSNPELSELYKANFEKIKALHKSSYIINDSTVIVSNTFGKYKTSFLDNIVNNPNQLYKYNKAERQNIINAINELSEYLSNNGLITDYNAKLLEFMSRDVPKIDSSIEIKSPLYKIFKRNGRVFGADQGAVRKVIENSKIDVIIQFVQGRYIGTDKFLQTLNEMNISEERFRKMLETSSRGFIFTNGDLKISELANLVIKNYPGMSGKDAVQFLHLLETEEAGGRGICNYASMANLIFDKYKNNTKLFEEHFGYPMYIEVNGKQRLNTSMLLVDMYSIINEGNLIKYENGIYKVEISNEYYNNLTTGYGTIAMHYFQTFLDKKGINFNISEEFRYNSFNTNNAMHYEEVIINIHDALARGEHVHLSSGGFNLYYPNGIIASKNVGSHIMSVVGITSDGKLIVDSWGQELIFNLEEQMSRVGELYKSHEHKYQKYIQLVSYNISMDGSENINNQSQSLNNSRMDNTSSLEVFDVPSPKAKSSLGSVPYRNTLDELLDSSRVERGTTNSISLDDSSASNTEATGYDYTVEISNPSAVNNAIATEDLKFIDESDVHVSTLVSINGVEITVETLKQLKTPSNLETALKTGEYAGVRVEKALVELSKLDGVTLDSKLQELVKISETLKENEIIFNIEDVYSNGVMPNTINIDVYNEFIRNNPNSNITIEDLYEIINSNSVIYRLISNDTIIKNASNESIKESFEYLSSIANRYNYENKVIREAQYLLDLMNDNYTTEELYDAFAIAHTEFNTPDVYYECYDCLKTMNVDSAVKLLESKGYTTLDITDAFLNVAIRMDSQELSKKYYYKAFDYLVENGMDEKEAATIIRDKYRTLLYRRGTRVVTTTPNGVKIRIVNNISSNNRLFTIEKIESMIKQAEKYYSKTGLKEIVIFDSFAPHNIYSEKVQYEDYVKTHNNRRFVAAASATKSSIILWEDFDKLDSIVHEYGHTIDKHIKVVNKLSTDFSSSSIWLEAIQKDTAITSKRVSEYAYATNGEDFAEFLKCFNRNSLDIARKYPNRYKAASKYLNLDIDSNIIERYLDSKKFFIEGIEDLSNLLTEDGSMLEFIKQYVFENLKGDNSIAKTVISNLDAIYESKLDIIEDYGLYSLFIDMSEQERIGSHEFIKIIKDYLDGKDISSKFKDARNLEIIELLEKEEIQEWYEEELNEMTAETEKIGVSDEEFEKMMNSLFNDSDSNSSSDTSIINDENTDIIYDSEVVDVNDEINKILKGDVYLKRFIMSKDTSLAKSISDLIKSGNVDLSSPIGVKLQQIVDTVVDNGHVINLDAFVYGTESPIVVSNEVYTEYQRISPGKSIKDLYKIVKENSLYEKLTGKERNMYIKSIDTLLGLSNDKNRLINELEVINKALKEEPSTAFDIISKYHMEAKLPQGYSEYSDLLKSGVSINEAISQLERLGYSYSEISYIVMSEAMITYNSDIVEKSYYDMFEYLKEKFIEENPKGIKKEQELIKYAEEEAAKKVRKDLTELFQIRGSKPVLVTSSGVEIRVVNNAQIDSTFIENISEQLSKIENIYGRSALETIVIYDTISPENLTNEIINYPKYREKFPNKHFMTQANATRTNINIYNSFNSLDTLSHEYGHTLDKGPLSTRVYNEKTRTFKTILFSESDAWQRAVKIDKKSVSSYGDLKLEEDFADFIKAYTKNPVATMLRYPNRYLEMSSKLGIKIDGKAISEYMSNTRLIDVLNSISNILETSTLDVIKEYVFNGQIDNNGYTFIDDILKDIRYDTLLDTIDASSVINEIQKSYNLTDEKVTFLLEQIIRGNSISDLLSESDIKLIEMLDDEGLRETYRDYLELNDVSTKDQIIEDADVEMPLPKKSIFSKKIETVSVSDIPRVFRNMNTSDIISILEGKTTLKNDENFINNKKSIIRFVKYLSENNIKLSLNERANTIIENLRNGDFRLNILNFSDVLNGDTPIYGPSSINLDGIKISTDDVMVYLENEKNEISSIITSDTPNEDARDLLNAIDELGSKNDIIYDKYRKSIKLIERIERSYVYRNYDSYYLLPKSFNGIDTSNILNSDLMSLTSYINSLSNADKKAYRVALDEFGKYIYKSNTKLSRQDLSRVNKLYDVINTKKFSPDTVIKSKVYDTFEMSYQNDGEFGSNQGKVREVIEKLGITNVIESLFDEKVEKSKFLQTLSEFNISERDFITALNKRTQIGIMNNLFKDGDINLELYSSLIKQVKMNYPNMSTMEAVRFLYLIETKEAGGPGICNNPIFVNMIFDRYIGRENIFERDFGYSMYIKANNGKKVLNEARLLVDIFSTLNDDILVKNVNGRYVISTTNDSYVRTYDLNGLRLDAIEKFINKKGINLNLSKTYFFNSNEELMHYDYLIEQIKSELDKGNYVIFGGKGFDMDVENFEFRKDCDAHGMTIVGIDTTGELILDSWGMKARVDLKKELSRLNTMFKDRNSNTSERIFTISSYNIN